jgi:HK97 family phage prohead protease
VKSPEIRTVREAAEFRASAKGGTMVGYAAKFNKTSRNLGGFVEQLAPSAFNKSLADGVRVMARYNHEALLGTTDAGTLRLSVDDIGLRYEIDMPDTTTGRDVSVLAARGDVRFSSFAFHVHADGDEWGYTDNDFPLRTLRSVQLVDIAPVDDPAYLDTEAGLRSLADTCGLDLAEVRSFAARNDLRALLKKDLDGPTAEEPQTPTAEQDDRSALDVARRRLELLRVPR